jgi:hypothetical protein
MSLLNDYRPVPGFRISAHLHSLTLLDLRFTEYRGGYKNGKRVISVSGVDLVDQRHHSTLESMIGMNCLKSSEKLDQDFVNINFEDEISDSDSADDSSSSASGTGSSILRIKQNHLRLSLKGLNLLAHSSFHAIGRKTRLGFLSEFYKSPNAEILLRLRNAAIQMDIYAIPIEGGKVDVKVVQPIISLGDIDYQFQQFKVGKLTKSMAIEFQMSIECIIQQTIRKVLADNIKSMIQTLEHQLMKTAESMLSQYFPVQIGRLKMDNMHWTVTDSQFVFGIYLDYVPSNRGGTMTDLRIYDDTY